MKETLSSLAAITLQTLVPILLAWGGLQLQRLLNLKRDDQASLAINTAVERAAGVVYQQATKLGIPLTDDVQLDPLYREAVRQIISRNGGPLARKDVTTTDLLAMTRGSVGQAMATDSTTAGPPGTENKG